MEFYKTHGPTQVRPSHALNKMKSSQQATSKSCNLLSCFSSTTNMDDESFAEIKKTFDNLAQKGNEEQILSSYCDHFTFKNVTEYFKRKYSIKTMVSNATKNLTIHSAATKNDTMAIKIFTTIKKVPVDLRNDEGFTPLLCASLSGHDEAVKCLLELGADVHKYLNEEGFGAIHAACQNGHSKVITTLLHRGGANIEDAAPDTPLQVALQFKQFQIVPLLVKEGADLQKRTSCGYTPLHSVALSGDLETAECLLKHGCLPNSLDNQDICPLFCASTTGNFAVAKLLLLSDSVVVDQQAADGSSSLHVACQEGYFDIVKLLLASGADQNLQAKDGFTPLISACQNGHLDIVRLLIENGADISLTTIDSFSILHLASKHGHCNVVDYLIDKIPSSFVNATYQHSFTALFLASFYGHTDVVDVLLSKAKADPNIPSLTGATPLIAASQEGHCGVVKLLLRFPGIDIDHKENLHGTTSLNMACSKGYLDVVEALLSSGCSPNIRNNNGQFPLMSATLKGDLNMIKLLLGEGSYVLSAAGANVDDKDALLVDTVFGKHKVLSKLPSTNSNCADVNLTVPSSGRTCLHAAAAFGLADVVKLLLLASANPNPVSSDGNTPLSLAISNGHTDVANLLSR